MNPHLSVLVTGAGSLLGQGILRALRASSLRLRIIAADPSPLSAGLYWADVAHLIPMADGSGYLRSIEAVLAQEKPDAVLIGTDVELGVLAQHRERIEREFSTNVIVSGPRVVAIANDKWKNYEFFKANGFDCPESCLPGDEDALIAQVGFPLIVKPRYGARSVGVQLVRDRQQLRHAVSVGSVIQECVGTPDDEYTAGALYFDGRCCASIVMRRELRDGNTYRAFADEYPELNRQVGRWTEQLRPYGPVNFQFRLVGDRAKIFEINARFSGTTGLRYHAGFNSVEMTLRHVLLGEHVVQPRIKPVIILRHWEETVLTPEALLFEDSRSACESGERPGRFGILRTAGGGIQGHSRASREHAPAPSMAALDASAVQNG
jgi:carbamoyl-phosphate synthase large subunit